MAIQLEVLSKDKRVINAQTDWVVVPGSEGEVGVLPGHAPLLTTLSSGILRYVSENGTVEQIAVHHGYAQIKDDHVVILGASVEKSNEIDHQRAQSAEQRAAAKMKTLLESGVNAAQSMQQMQVLDAKMKRALVRQSVASN